MLNKNYLLFILPIAAILLLPLLISSCKQPDSYITPVGPPPCDTCLPPITTTGPTSFGCRVNGKVWLPKYGATYTIYAGYFDSAISIRGTNGETMERVGFALESITDTGTFVFPNNTFKYSGAGFNFITKPIYENFSASPITKGRIQFLRFDIDSGKYAGTFEFDVYSNDFKDTIHITDGRFMIHK